MRDITNTPLTAPARGRAMAEDRNAQLFVSLYSKMALALGVTPTPMRAEVGPAGRMGGFRPEERPQSLMTILNPGKYIPPNMDSTSPDTQYDISVLFDQV